MNIFTDLLQTMSLILPVFVTVLVLSIALTVLVLWVYDHFIAKKEPQPVGALAEWFDSYAEPRVRMKTVMAGSEGSGTHFLEDLLTQYRLSMVIDSNAGVVRFEDRRFYELKNKVVSIPVREVLGADEQQACKVIRQARYRLNRRARTQGIIPSAHRLEVMKHGI